MQTLLSANLSARTILVIYLLAFQWPGFQSSLPLLPVHDATKSDRDLPVM